jgi:hypothetical protein
MKEKHYVRLGAYVNYMAQHYIPDEEKGRAIAEYYLMVVKEAERDARDEANGKRGD